MGKEGTPPGQDSGTEVQKLEASWEGLRTRGSLRTVTSEADGIDRLMNHGTELGSQMLTIWGNISQAVQRGGKGLTLNLIITSLEAKL
jgi:hypothetical protein